MLWVILAFTTAISLSTADALSKKALGRTDTLTIAWVRDGYALPFLAVGAFFIPMPALDGVFWSTIAILIPLELAAVFLYMKAIKVSPLSLTVPFLALSPVFIMLIAFFVLGERPGAYGIAGVCVITAGVYLLNAGPGNEGVLGPLKAIAREKGSLLMIAVAFIYSFTSTLSKVAMEHSSPEFIGFFYPLILSTAMAPFLAAKGRLKAVVSRPLAFLAIGFFTAIMIYSHFMAISMTQVAYMISVKRTSILFGILYGKLLFGETGIRMRLLGSILMVCGVALIVAFDS